MCGGFSFPLINSTSLSTAQYKVRHLKRSADGYDWTARSEKKRCISFPLPINAGEGEGLHIMSGGYPGAVPLTTEHLIPSSGRWSLSTDLHSLSWNLFSRWCYIDFRGRSIPRSEYKRAVMKITPNEWDFFKKWVLLWPLMEIAVLSRVAFLPRDDVLEKLWLFFKDRFDSSAAGFGYIACAGNLFLLHTLPTSLSPTSLPDPQFILISSEHLFIRAP